MKSLIITLLAAMYFGFGFCIEMFGVKAGLSSLLCLVIFQSSLIVWVLVAFTCLQDVKDILKKTKNNEQVVEGENNP